ncbi:O-antigen ligase family protein [bacterium 210820-DFI.6.37]|nr:O-antigen ligase family protein [bacterium 210820-DFI.6.37]
MIIKISNIRKALVIIAFMLTFFSSACLWNEQSLSNYIMCSMVVIGITVLTYMTKPLSLNKIINNRYILWGILTYALFEAYGFFFLRIGEFNWDFILVSGILQICLTIMLMELDSENEVISVLSVSSLISIIIVCAYMIHMGSIRLSNITFGSSFGLELSGNRNTVATIIGIMLVPVVYMVLRYKKLRFIFATISVGATICMLLTGSKKGIVVIIMIMIMIFMTERKAIKYLLFPIAIILGAYAVFNIPILYNVVGFRLQDMFATFGIGTAATTAQSTSIRNSYILMGLKSMWNHPLFGGGMNYFQYINNAHYYSHNNYIELLNNFGIVGTLIYYVPFVKKIPELYKNVKFEKVEEKRTVEVFLFIYLLTKFVLDYAMVSYSTMCVFNIEFLVVYEVLRRRKVESE